MRMKLGVNIDHVATLRQARGGTDPVPYLAALEAEKGGADGITIHLREDRRHIQDHDVREVQKAIHVPLNLEMSVNPQIVRIALRIVPGKVCLVPERRQELTTEGGLDICSQEKLLSILIPKFRQKGIEVSLFIDPEPRQIMASGRVGTDAIEIHTGAYANACGAKRQCELYRIKAAVALASKLRLKVHAGHGLNYENVHAIARIPQIKELNIGHSIISRSVFVGIRQAVAEMKKAMAKS